MARQILGRGFRCVAAEPGQRHLVAVHGLRFGPDDRRQGGTHGGIRPGGSPGRPSVPAAGPALSGAERRHRGADSAEPVAA